MASWRTYQIYNDDRVIAVLLTLPGAEVRLIEQEGGHVGREDGGVHDEQQDQPVPGRLEWAVVEDGPLLDARGLEPVLWQDVGAQRQHLQPGVGTSHQPANLAHSSLSFSIKFVIFLSFFSN